MYYNGVGNVTSATLIQKMARGGEDPELSNVAASVDAMAKEMSKTSHLFAAEFMSAAQKIIPSGATGVTKEGR